MLGTITTIPRLAPLVLLFSPYLGIEVSTEKYNVISPKRPYETPITLLHLAQFHGEVVEAVSLEVDMELLEAGSIRRKLAGKIIVLESNGYLSFRSHGILQEVGGGGGVMLNTLPFRYNSRRFPMLSKYVRGPMILPGSSSLF